MSFGFGISDFAMLLKGLAKLTRILRGEAVESFMRCTRTYRTFAKVARHLDSLVASSDIDDNSLLHETRREMETLLNNYFHRIENFRLLLGSGRIRKSVKSAIAKIRWVQHANELEELRQDLQMQIIMANLAISSAAKALPNFQIQVFPDFLGQGSIPRVPLGDYFVFEDARRKLHLVFFNEMPNWEHLHEFLLRVFPSHDRGHEAILSRAYLLHNATADRDIVPSGPRAKPVQDAVTHGERIEMNVIFPDEDFEPEKCPKCNTIWGGTTSVVINCHQCGLHLRFMDSLEYQIDPITQVSVKGMRDGGLKADITEFAAEIERDGCLDGGMTQRELKNSISRKLQGLRFSGQDESTQRRSKIRDFRRVTLCQPRWPTFRRRYTCYQADIDLAIIMGNLKSFLKYVQAGTDLPMEMVAQAMGSNMAGARSTAWIERIAKEICLQYDSGAQRRFLSMLIIPVLETYSQCAAESMFQFDPAIVKVRCLLWTILHILELEGKVLLSCSKALYLLSPLFRSHTSEREKSHPLEKLMGVLFVPHAIIWRLIFDVLDDAVSLFSNTVPPPVSLGAIFSILKDSSALCLDYYSEGSLDERNLICAPSTLFDKTAFTSDTIRANWLASYRHCLESVLGTEGDSLLAQENIRQLVNFWNSI